MTKISRGLQALTGLALAAGLMTAVSLTSCKKVSSDKVGEHQSKVRMDATDMKISMDEIYAQLPQTIMYNFADKVKIDISRSEWIYEQEYLMVRIPLNDEVNKSYLYAVKCYNDPMAKPKVYLSQFIPDNADDSKPADFSGKQIWLNLQDWQIYGVQFEHNKAVGYMQPVPIDPPDWESEMLNAGLFYLDENDKIAVYEEPQQSVMVLRGGNPRDHGDKLFGPGKGKGFFGWLSEILGSIGDWLGDGASQGNPGGGAPWTGGEPGRGYGDDPRYHGGGGPIGGESGGGYDSSEDPSSPDYHPPVDIWGHVDGSTWASAGGTMTGPVSAGTGTMGNATVSFLTVTLDLNAQQAAWLLQHNDKARRMKAYILTVIPTITMEEKKSIMKEHLERMRTDPAYYTFVNNYDQNHTGMWWMNEDWLDDLSNFELTPNSGLNTGIKATWNTLTAAEKALVKLYPVQAYIIFTRFGEAQNTSIATNLPGQINGKQNAFCHAFFQAICTRDMMVRLSPYISRAQFVVMFSTAHESEVPAILTLEKQMDLFNNWVGIQYGESIFPLTLNSTVKSDILAKVTNGELKYLTPLDYTASDEYDKNHDKVQDCTTCLNGIISATQLKPTNQ